MLTDNIQMISFKIYFERINLPKHMQKSLVLENGEN